MVTKWGMTTFGIINQLRHHKAICSLLLLLFMQP